MGCVRNDVTGKRFGRLVALRTDRRDKHHNRLWVCQCDCGNEIEKKVGDLVTGNTMSCGCLKSIAAGLDCAERSAEHRAWSSMRQRCLNPQHPQFRDWGGRGITICERWDQYVAFLSDMGRRPSPKHSLDRIDVNGNYEPSNCRWTTKDVQQHNRRAKSNTGHLGVSWQARDQSYSWACTRRGQQRKGTCKSLEEAIAARNAAKQELYGEVA